MNRQSTLSRFAACALGLCLLAALPGCQDTPVGHVEPWPSNVVVVTGACANQPRHSYAAIEDTLAKAVQTNGYGDVVVADGSPSSQVGGIGRMGSTANNATRRAQEEAAIEASLMAACSDALADDPQTDLLKALRFAASGLAGRDGDRTVCVLHSGLTTAGLVDLASDPDWLYVDHAALADALADQLPDLSAVDTVYWYDLGAAAGDQAEPDQPTVAQLKDLWETLLLRGGVGSVVFCDTQTDGAENPSEQPVSFVALRVADKPVLEASASEAPVLPAVEEFIEALTMAPIEIPESSVGFVPDTADFLDVAAARSELAVIAEALAAHPEVSVWLTGSCAGCPWAADRGMALSQARAEAVANLLVEMGVSRSQLTCEGVGDGSNERVQHVPDLASDGVTQTGDAQRNRRVVVTRMA